MESNFNPNQKLFVQPQPTSITDIAYLHVLNNILHSEQSSRVLEVQYQQPYINLVNILAKTAEKEEIEATRTLLTRSFDSK